MVKSHECNNSPDNVGHQEFVLLAVQLFAYLFDLIDVVFNVLHFLHPRLFHVLPEKFGCFDCHCKLSYSTTIIYYTLIITVH